MDIEFSDDVCRCKWCLAIIYIPFDKSYIPISYEEYWQLLFGNAIFPVRNLRMEYRADSVYLTAFKSS